MFINRLDAILFGKNKLHFGTPHFKNLNIKKYDDIVRKSKADKIQSGERIRQLREEIKSIEDSINVITAEEKNDKQERERNEAILDAVWTGDLQYRMGPPWFSEETIHWNIYEDRIEQHHNRMLKV